MAVSVFIIVETLNTRRNLIIYRVELIIASGTHVTSHIDVGLSKK